MRWRFLPFYLVFIFCFFVLLWRLFNLTIIKGNYYRQLSEGNRIQEKTIRAPRGIIYDRKDQVLTRNVPVDRRQTADGKWQNLTRNQALEIEAKGGSEAGNLQTDLGRNYPYAGLLAHVLGYTGEVTEKELKMDNGQWKMGDLIGRTGIEEKYEDILRGVDGKELVEIDAKGQKIRKLGEKKAQPGQNLTLSLDLDLQKVAAVALGEKTGAIVVSIPTTGEILSLYSSPSFDPNNVSNFGDLNNLETQPFFNRAIAGLYPPGSTFKIITGAAGLETGKINRQTTVEDTGEIVIGPYRFPNWYWLQYGGKDGTVDIIKAYQRSNDIFFYKVGEWVGVKDLETWAGKFGVGKILGIDLPGEAGGLMPTPEWRKKASGTDWYLGDTYHLAIGQGDLETTPLQVNFWTNVIANGGKLCKPTTLKTENSTLNTKNCKDIGLKKGTVDLIREGMREACSPGGTGWPLFNFKAPSSNKEIPVACKTGTAEYGDPKDKTHAWFTVFAPIEEPELTITVLVEGGGEGSNVAAPIAKKILEEWFGR